MATRGQTIGVPICFFIVISFDRDTVDMSCYVNRAERKTQVPDISFGGILEVEVAVRDQS